MIDWTKPVETRDGRKVRVLCTDGPTTWPIVGVVEESIYQWPTNGVFSTFGTAGPLDLVNVQEKRTVWINVYPDGHSAFHRTKEDADSFAYATRIKCIPVEYTV